MSDTISKNDQGFLDRHFKLKAKGTNVRTEIIAGITTFVAMAYIIFVNPSILKEAGIPVEAAVAATIWSAALCTIAMGLLQIFRLLWLLAWDLMPSLPSMYVRL